MLAPHMADDISTRQSAGNRRIMRAQNIGAVNNLHIVPAEFPHQLHICSQIRRRLVIARLNLLIRSSDETVPVVKTAQIIRAFRAVEYVFEAHKGSRFGQAESRLLGASNVRKRKNVCDSNGVHAKAPLLNSFPAYPKQSDAGIRSSTVFLNPLHYEDRSSS